MNAVPTANRTPPVVPRKLRPLYGTEPAVVVTVLARYRYASQEGRHFAFRANVPVPETDLAGPLRQLQMSQAAPICEAQTVSLLQSETNCIDNGHTTQTMLSGLLREHQSQIEPNLVFRPGETSDLMEERW